jgi:hypothetical protein
VERIRESVLTVLEQYRCPLTTVELRANLLDQVGLGPRGPDRGLRPGAGTPDVGLAVLVRPRALVH